MTIAHHEAPQTADMATLHCLMLTAEAFNLTQQAKRLREGSCCPASYVDGSSAKMSDEFKNFAFYLSQTSPIRHLHAAILDLRIKSLGEERDYIAAQHPQLYSEMPQQ